MLVNVKILSANELHSLPVSNGNYSADIPVDGNFHPINSELLSVLADSNVAFETENAGATGGVANAEGAAGLGSAAAPSVLGAVEAEATDVQTSVETDASTLDLNVEAEASTVQTDVEGFWHHIAARFEAIAHELF